MSKKKQKTNFQEVSKNTPALRNCESSNDSSESLDGEKRFSYTYTHSSRIFWMAFVWVTYFFSLPSHTPTGTPWWPLWAIWQRATWAESSSTATAYFPRTSPGKDRINPHLCFTTPTRWRRGRKFGCRAAPLLSVNISKQWASTVATSLSQYSNTDLNTTGSAAHRWHCPPS